MHREYKEAPDQNEYSLEPRGSITIHSESCPIMVSFANHSITITREGKSLICVNELGQTFTIPHTYSLQTSRGSDGWYLEDRRRDYPRIKNNFAGEKITIDNLSDELTYTITENAAEPDMQLQIEQTQQDNLKRTMDIVNEDENTRVFENFDKVRCDLGDIDETSGIGTRTIIFKKEANNEIDIIIQDINDRITLKQGESVDIGRNFQPEWFTEERCKSISRKHMTVTNQNGNLIIVIHNKYPSATLLKRVS